MKGQDQYATETAYDVYLTRGTESFFSKRYFAEGAAKRRAEQLDEVWKKAGYKASIKSVEIKKRERTA